MASRTVRMQEEAIPDDLLASIPLVDGDATTTFAIENEEVIAAPPARGSALNEPVPFDAAGAPLGAALAQQLRYDLGEALARELDRAGEAFASSVNEIETKLAETTAALRHAHEALIKEREGRELAEKRLAAFKELALK